VSVGEDALRLANLRLGGLIEQETAGFICARCYRATDLAALLERSACSRCGGRIFVRLAGEGRVRRVCLAE
jgi:DNA-directed RNA polymerase subunit RPC12/RpoP